MVAEWDRNALVADGAEDGSAHQTYAPTQPLLRRQAHSAVMPLLLSLRLGVIPDCGPASHHAVAVTADFGHVCGHRLVTESFVSEPLGRDSECC